MTPPPRRNSARTPDESGFTLMELMIVMSMLGLLAMIGFASFENFRVFARRSACVAHQHNLVGPGILYGLENSIENQDVNVSALIAADLIPAELAECAESFDNSFNDYTMVYGPGQLADVECDVEGVAHPYNPSNR